MVILCRGSIFVEVFRVAHELLYLVLEAVEVLRCCQRVDEPVRSDEFLYFGEARACFPNQCFPMVLVKVEPLEVL